MRAFAAPGSGALVGGCELRIGPDARPVAEAAGFARAGTFTDDDETEMIRYARSSSAGGPDSVTK